MKFKVLKSTDDNFIINEPNRPSKSGLYEYNGDSFDYDEDIQHIMSKGILKRSVGLLLFARTDNTGIFYEYVLPIGSEAVSEEEEMQTQWNELGDPLDDVDENVSNEMRPRVKERHRRKFSWKLLGFGQCSRTCGSGVQQPIFRCIRESPTRYYTPKRCSHLEKPVFSEDIYKCNRGLCSAFWRVDDFESKCKSEIDTALDVVIQCKVECMQEQITGRIESVKEKYCDLKQKPNITEICKCKLRKIHTLATTEKTSHKYARLTSAVTSTMIRSFANGSQPLRRHMRNDRNDKTGVWLMSSWTQQCQSCAGPGFEHRSVYCDRTAPYTDLCDLRFTPQQKRICQGLNNECERGNWLVSEWTNCTGDCFNLQRQRIVVCILQGKIVDDMLCEKYLPKPIGVKNCTQDEVDLCGPQWHYSDWSECSQSCGEGQQRRYAKCLEYDWHQNTLVESIKCSVKEREPVFGTCNVQKCEELDTILENVQRPVNTTTMTPCSDDFSNCKRINRRLCKLQYYKIYCCQTCQNYL